MTPYFLTLDKETFQFDSGTIAPAEMACADCGEPLVASDGELCHWCAISEKMKEMAAMRNPMRLLNNLGMLEDYVREMDEIGRSGQQPKE